MIGPSIYRTYGSESSLLDDRRWAPYAREVIEQQRADRFPAAHIFSGSNGWNHADYRRRNYGPGSALVLPEDRFPHEFRWPALDNPVIFPSEIAPAKLEALMRALLESGSKNILIRKAPGYLFFEQSAVSTVFAGSDFLVRATTRHA